MSGLLLDLRHAVAVYRGTPVASAIAVIALAVSMAFVSAFLSLWNDLALKPPAGFESGQLVTIGQSGGYQAVDGSAPLTLSLVEGINETVGALDFAAGITMFPQLLQLDTAVVPIQAEAVTRHFSDLEPRLRLGRRFDEQDHRADGEPAVILSYRLWQSQFAGREDVLGQTARLSEVGFNGLPVAGQVSEPRGQDYRVVGVMSPRMTGTFTDSVDVWLPFEQAVPFLYGDPDESPQFNLAQGASLSVRPDSGASVPSRMRGLARPRAGVSVEAINNDLNARFAIEGQALTQGIELSGEEIRFDVIEGIVRDIDLQRESKRQIRLFLAGTLLLVIVAACNVSLFLLARASRRQRELGIRMAVGASIKRLARQLASEAGMLILIATVVGVFLSVWLSAVLQELPFLQQAEWRDVSPFDWRVLGLLSVVMLLLTLLVSLAPILGLRRAGIGQSSGMVTARAGWGQRLAGTAQIAVTVVVGAVAVAFAWHLVFYATIDRGFDPRDVLVVELDNSNFRCPEPPCQESIAIERERQRDIIVGLPGVEDASFTTFTPGGAGFPFYTIVQREARGDFVELLTINVDGHYFDVLDIPFIAGQDVIPTDRTQIVGNEIYAVETFGRIDAIGEVTPNGNRTLRGVVRNVAYGHPAEALPMIGYSPYSRSAYPILILKTQLSPAEMRGLLQQKIDAGELEIELGDVNRLATIAGKDLLADRARSALTASSALLVVILSALGFYGTQRYLVTVGQREYAIRSAIGAGPGALGRLVLSRGVSLALPGLIFGAMLAFIVVAWLRDGFLAQAVSPIGVTTMVVLTIVVLVFAASVGPARQARKTAPAELLRQA
jgi:predicted permease